MTLIVPVHDEAALAAHLATLDPFASRDARLVRYGRSAGVVTPLRGTAAILSRFAVEPAVLR